MAAGRTTGASGATRTFSSSLRRCRGRTRRSGSAPAARPRLTAAADAGFQLLLDQVASFETIAERLATYRERVIELDGEFHADTDVAVTRSLHLVGSPSEREAAIRRRVDGFAEVAKLTNDGSGPRNRMAADYTSDIRAATEAGAIIGDADECVERLDAAPRRGRRVRAADRPRERR